MRFVEINGNMRVPISKEESLMLEQIIHHDGPMPRGKLTMREKELARMLVHRGVLNRVMIDEKVHFIYNDLDPWR